MRCRGVGPAVGERAKGGTLLSHGAQDVAEIPCGAREPIEAGDREHVPGLQPVEKLLELNSLPLGAADLLLEYLLGAGCLELLNMRVEGLPVDARPLAGGGGLHGLPRPPLGTQHLARAASGDLSQGRRRLDRLRHPVCPSRVDHGSDFTSAHLEQVAADLRIRLIQAAVARPQGQSKVERHFGTITTELLP